MQLVKPKRKSAAENVLPLINVVFLLLIFFMLAGALEKADLLDIEPPETLSTETPDDTTAMLLVDDDGTLSFRDEIVPRAQIVARLQAYFAEHPDGRLKLKADAGSDAADVIALIEELRAVGLKELGLLATGAS
ncbi:biopolymer transporter ExbD [Nisaea acidiphila]|uniref:Biopolymer transporter ExbD n=1 Tax=Nisaea acidiphila TaxID=1862145 RepID=A0A9J7AMZ7_9PROT|nr:biopolymer transporter ExbD [Nisaea acidiphila]UUX49011.1 biopolymer transporter ExbD [Nisaea acidiphila]